MAKLLPAAMTPVDDTRGNHSDLSLAEVPSQFVWPSRRQVQRTAVCTGCQRCGVIGHGECLNQGAPQHRVPGRIPPDWAASAQGREWCQTGLYPDRRELTCGGYLPICLERDARTGAVGE